MENIDTETFDFRILDMNDTIISTFSLEKETDNVTYTDYKIVNALGLFPKEDILDIDGMAVDLIGSVSNKTTYNPFNPYNEDCLELTIELVVD